MNYKGTVRRITVVGVETSVPASGKIVMLHDQVDGSNAADGFIDVADNLIYSVPTGKTLRILGIAASPNTAVAGDTVVISSGDTENAETATLQTLLVPLENQLHWFTVDYELAAGKFLTYNPSTTTVDMIAVIGYEY